MPDENPAAGREGRKSPGVASTIGGCLGLLVLVAFVGGLFYFTAGRWAYYVFVSVPDGEHCESSHMCESASMCVEHLCRAKCKSDSECHDRERCRETTRFEKVCAP